MRRYLNSSYPDNGPGAAPTDTIPGTDVWIEAAVKRGKKPDPPTVVWTAIRTRKGDDGLYVPDPEFVAVPAPPAAKVNKCWARVRLPEVTGVTWSFKVVRTKKDRTDKTIAVKGSIETWKRMYLDVAADSDPLYRLFKTALPVIKRSFQAANIEMIENCVTVAGEETAADKSKKDNLRLGEICIIELHDPAADASDQAPYHVAIENGQPDCNGVTLVGNTLTVNGTAALTLSAAPVTEMVVMAGDRQLVQLSKILSQCDGAEETRDRAVAALATICQRTGDRQFTIALDAAPMANSWNAAAGTWSTPRALTVAQAKTQGPIKLSMRLSVSVQGGKGGDCVRHVIRGRATNVYRTFLAATASAAEMAITLVHELGHGLGLVKLHNLQKYDVEQVEYVSNAARRVPGARQQRNALHYLAVYGGSGEHCHNAATEDSSCITQLGRTYLPDGSGNGLCVMYHGTHALRRAAFCDSCIKQIRGR